MDSPQYRHELKYLISQAQVLQLQNRLSHLMPLDKNASETGMYRIRSMYFDDYDNRCFYENLNGTDPREKYRIRIYNSSDRRIALECKRKERGKTLKTSAVITMEQYRQLVSGRPLTGWDNQSQVVNRLSMEILNRAMHPAVIVEYDRIPYTYANGNVRITLDTNISSSSAFDRFFEPSIPRRPVMPAGLHLLEVKYDEFLPDVIYHTLQLDSLQQTAYSKYFLCRKYGI